MQGYLSIVLHAHLPFVRHPEHEKFLEESWLFEAITETFLKDDSGGYLTFSDQLNSFIAAGAAYF